MKLSKTQQELYDAMKAGVGVHYMRYMGSLNPSAYYWREDNNQRVTAAASALIEKGIAKQVGKHNDIKLVLVEGI